ncbi:unnamed protein product [Peniophora sp. CBMAI 1063]|nr:unnamed protein product [Peniophora sp. CBMAI 1063]
MRLITATRSYLRSYSLLPTPPPDFPTPHQTALDPHAPSNLHSTNDPFSNPPRRQALRPSQTTAISARVVGRVVPGVRVAEVIGLKGDTSSSEV